MITQLILILILFLPAHAYYLSFLMFCSHLALGLAWRLVLHSTRRYIGALGSILSDGLLSS